MSQLIALNALGNFCIETFLSEYWQKQPLLVRGAIDPNLLDITGDDLAGLALESDVESRMVIESEGSWQLQHGPFTEVTFAKTPESHWTLLVQAVDHFVPEVHALLDLFRFLPNWRLDDIMISYAADKGSVGPHFDQYDVFLLQGMGRRHWQIGPHCGKETELAANTELSIIKNFSATHEWTLSPGDLLYLPPGVAHFGVAHGECITYSVGFRSPSKFEALSSFIDHLAKDSRADERYQDSGRNFHPGEIAADELEHFRRWLLSEANSAEQFARWFGLEMTRGKYNTDEFDHDDSAHNTDLPDLDQILANAGPCSYVKALDSRWAFRIVGSRADLFVAGQQWRVSTIFAKTLCSASLFEESELRALAQSTEDALALRTLLTQDLLQPE